MHRSPNLVVVTTEILNSPYLRDPDVQLMLRAKDGDEVAFTELVTNYQDRIVGIFSHLLGSKDAAEDLAQEVFLRVYRSRANYRAKAKFSTWLFRIANNLASNTRRNKGRRKEVNLNPQDSGPLGMRPEEQILMEKSGLMPARQIGLKETQAVVREALGTLNERQQMAVLLHKFEGMSYADIGAAMKLSEAAVKSLLSRARDNLRVQLEKHINS